MREYMILLDMQNKRIIDTLPFCQFERLGHLNGLSRIYNRILPEPRQFGWCDCRTVKATQESKKYLKTMGFT